MDNENAELLKDISCLISPKLTDSIPNSNAKLLLNFEEIDMILTILYESKKESAMQLATSMATLLSENDNESKGPILEVKHI